MLFGEYLKQIREDNKLSIRQLALYSKVSASYISQIENGERNKPKPEILQKLSKPLKVSYEELMAKAGYIEEEQDESVSNPLEEINKLVKQHGFEQFGFFDIEKWKNLGPEELDEVRRHFEWVAQKAAEKNKDKK